jgi:hypothetical protein
MQLAGGSAGGCRCRRPRALQPEGAICGSGLQSTSPSRGCGNVPHRWGLGAPRLPPPVAKSAATMLMYRPSACPVSWARTPRLASSLPHGRRPTQSCSGGAGDGHRRLGLLGAHAVAGGGLRLRGGLRGAGLRRRHQLLELAEGLRPAVQDLLRLLGACERETAASHKSGG